MTRSIGEALNITVNKHREYFMNMVFYFEQDGGV